jgi:hypothetical protein
MAAKDKVHQPVVNALRKDGWTITHDPLRVGWKKHNVLIDLGAERLIAAHRGSEKIAVEIKSFIGANDLEDLYHAIGQFVLYRKALRKADPQRVLFLAIDLEAYRQTFDDPEGESLRAEEEIKLIVFDKQTEEIVLWKQ